MISHHASTNNEFGSHSSRNIVSTTKAQYKANLEGGTFHQKFDSKLREFRKMQLIARQRTITSRQQVSTNQTQASSSTSGGDQSAQVISDPASNRSSVPISSTASNQKNASNLSTSTKDSQTTQSTVAKSSSLADAVSKPAGNSSNSSNQTASTAAIASVPVANRTTSSSTAPKANQTLSSPLLPPSAAQQTLKVSKKGLSSSQIIPLVIGILIGLVILGWSIAWFHQRARHKLHGARKVNKINIKGPFKKQEENSIDTEPIFGERDQKKVTFDSFQIMNEKSVTFGKSTFINSPPQPSFIPPTTVAPQTNSPIAAPKVMSIHATENLISSRPDPLSPSYQAGNPPLLDYRFKGPQMEGKVFQVERTYQAVLADELVISVGDRIEVAISYDDGWCLGRKLDVKAHDKNQLTKGVFPRDCLGARAIDLSKNLIPSPNDGRDSLCSGNYSRSGFRAISSYSSLSPLNSSIFEKFPIPPGANKVQGKQRTSSLFIDRTTQLFLELGDALGEPINSNSPTSV